MLVLKIDCGVVIRGRVPQAAASDRGTLVLHLSGGDLDDNLVPRNVQLQLAFFLDLVRDARAQSLEFVPEVSPLLYHLLVDFSLELPLENLLRDELCLGRVELLIFLGPEMVGWQHNVDGGLCELETVQSVNITSKEHQRRPIATNLILILDIDFFGG